MSRIAAVAEMVGRTGLPASVHTERVVLGAMMSDMVALQDGLEQCSERLFSLDSHRRIFGACRRVSDAGLDVQLVTLNDDLKNRHELEGVGGPMYVASLYEGLPRNLSIASYVSVLQRKAAEREALLLLEEFGQRILSGEQAPEEILSDLVVRAQDIEAGSSTAYYPVCDAVPAVMADMVSQRDRHTGLLGITTGLCVLDEFTTGFRAGELTYVGALPGRGKTSFMLQAMYAAASAGHRCGMISLEMRTGQLLKRMALMATTLAPWKIRDAKSMSRDEFNVAMKGIESVGGLPIFACDQDGLRPYEIAQMARRMVRQDGVEILFLDFVQIVQETGRTQKEAIDRVSAALRSIAKNLQIPVVVASQMARRDADVNRVPTLQDLRESGNLEQDAHNVFLLYRPVDRQSSKFTGEDQVIVAKAREGGVGAIPVTYDQRSLTYVSRESTNEY